jgi:hypothetical protein
MHPRPYGLPLAKRRECRPGRESLEPGNERAPTAAEDAGMDKARLIALIAIAAAVALVLAAAHAGFHPIGMNDGGYW